MSTAGQAPRADGTLESSNTGGVAKLATVRQAGASDVKPGAVVVKEQSGSKAVVQPMLKKPVQPSFKESAIPSEQVGMRPSHPHSAFTSQTKQLPKFSGQKKFKFSEPPAERS